MDIFQARTQRNDIAVLQDGLLAPARMGDAYGLAVQDAHGKYYDAARRGRLFCVTNSAAQALSLNNTTATGIIIFNPSNSGVNVAILEVIVSLQSLPAGASTAILTGGVQGSTVSQTTTNVANGVQPGILLGAALTGNTKTTVGSSATIATANIQRIIPLATAATVAASTSFPPFAKDDVAGALVIPPGFVTSLQCLTTAITVVGQITWEEIPV